MRHTIKIAVMIVAVVAAVMSGLALAQTEEQTETYQSGVLEQLAPLVDEGIISQDQANSIADSFTERFSERLALRAERRADREAFHQEMLTLLGVTSEELQAAIADGMTLAEVAEGEGVAVDDVIDLMVGHAEERLTQAVADERLTQEEADERLADITDKITDKVNNGGGFGPGFGPGHRHGPDGEGFGGRGFGGRGGGPGFGPGFGATDDAPAVDAVNA